MQGFVELLDALTGCSTAVVPAVRCGEHPFLAFLVPDRLASRRQGIAADLNGLNSACRSMRGIRFVMAVAPPLECGRVLAGIPGLQARAQDVLAYFDRAVKQWYAHAAGRPREVRTATTCCRKLACCVEVEMYDIAGSPLAGWHPEPALPHVLNRRAIDLLRTFPAQRQRCSDCHSDLLLCGVW